MDAAEQATAPGTTTTVPAVSAEIPNWAREALKPGVWSPSRRLLAAVRLYQRYQYQGGRRARANRMLAVVQHRLWSAVTGADIPLNAHIDGGLVMPHPNGIVIHPEARVGPNCLLLQQVTLGQGPVPGLPVLVGHVDVGAGAKILGGVTVGKHAVVGANAVVIRDVPEGATVVGVPAHVVQR
jgi:serine O-acetyltransferase